MQKSRPIKPLGRKAYGSIPHLPGSRLGPGDHHCEEGQARIVLEKRRDLKDTVIIQEKLDGSCVSVARINGELVPITRAGYRCEDSPHLVHRSFELYVRANLSAFDRMLDEGERVVGEYLAMAHGTRYELWHEPFVPFDIMQGVDRLPYLRFIARCKGWQIPFFVGWGPMSIDTALQVLGDGAHGAIDPVEGLVFRVERNGKVDFLCKYVQHFKQDGKYFGDSPIWNTDKYIPL